MWQSHVADIKSIFDLLKMLDLLKWTKSLATLNTLIPISSRPKLKPEMYLYTKHQNSIDKNEVVLF